RVQKVLVPSRVTDSNRCHHDVDGVRRTGPNRRSDHVFQFLQITRSPKDGSNDGEKRTACTGGAAESTTCSTAAFGPAQGHRPGNDWYWADGVFRRCERLG